MKKRFTFLIAALMLLVFMMPSVAGWGQTKTETTTTYTFSTKSWAASPANWTSGKDGNSYQNNQGVQVTTGCSGANATSPISFSDISKVEVRYCTNSSSGVGTIKIQVGSGTEKSFSVTKPSSGGTTLKTATFDYSTNETGEVKITVNCTTNSVYIYSVAITTSSSGSSVATPQLSKGTSYCDEDQSITITCDTEDATIYYTLDDTEPTSTSSPYSGSISITETTTLRAIAIKDDVSSEEVSATYTFVTTLKTMEAIFNGATTPASQVYIHFNNWVITGNNGSNSNLAYLTDGTYGCIIYGTGHGFVAGDVLNGVVPCTLGKQNGMARLENLTASTSGLEVTTGGTVTPVERTITALSAINTGSVVTIKGLTYDGTVSTPVFSDGDGNQITKGNNIYNASLVSGNTYDITGVIDFGFGSVPMRINPRNAADVVPGPATLPFEWAGGGKNALMALQGVTAYGLGSDYADANAPYLVKFDNTDDYILVRTDSQPDVVTIGVKMLGGSSTSTITVQASTDGVNFDAGEVLTISGSSNAELELTTTRTFGADVRYIKMLFTKGSNVGVGPITITKYIEKYNIILSSPTTGGSFTTDKDTAAAGETVTLTPVPAPHYVFDSWTVCKTDEPGTTVPVNNNQFVMPAYPVTVSATFTALQERTIIIPTEIEDNVAVDVSGNKAYAGDEVTIMIYAPTKKFLTSLTVTGYTTSNLITLSPEVSSEIDEYTFTMPDEDVTIAATFAGEFTVQFSVNGTVTGSQTPTPGESVTLTSQVPPTGFEFAGWTTNPTNFDNIITGSSYTPTADVTLYAVYSRTITGTTVTAYNKVSSISAGDYLIVCENSNVAFDGSLGTLDAVGNTISVNIENNTIASSASTDGAVFTISTIQDGYSIQSASRYYIGQTSDANGLLSNAETVYTNTIRITDGDADIVSSGGAYLRYNSASNQTRFRYYKSSSYTGQQAIQLYKKETTTPSTTEYYTRVFPSNTTATANITIEGHTVIESGVVLDMGEFTLTCNNPANLVIKDGAQLKVYTTGAKDGGVQATVEKNISGYGGDNTVKTGWNFIASPIDVNNLAPTDVTNMLSNAYDLYQLNNTNWENYENQVHTAGFTIDNGRGYLYANSEDVTLSFAGAIKPFTTANNGNKVQVSAGWNLIGNPYTFDVYVDQSYYSISQAQAGITANTDASNADAIKPCTSILVYAKSEGSVEFLENLPVSSTGNHSNIQMVLAHNVNVRGDKRVETIDNAIVSFNEGSQLEKFYFGNPSASIFIPQNGEDYAIAFSDRQGDVPLYFKANETGTY
ncbi:MAG: chitobiase/beta-hexosaminidase C-terminal domain-containing protein, partial [Bacteroidales bacterium]|nr:chitobiase/beta-hexosaminidase C-terminal domain-containing protein [Bacteroidales bacterium]